MTIRLSLGINTLSQNLEELYNPYILKFGYKDFPIWILKSTHNKLDDEIEYQVQMFAIGVLNSDIFIYAVLKLSETLDRSLQHRGILKHNRQLSTVLVFFYGMIS